jgi:signal transduction histidine kinase
MEAFDAKQQDHNELAILRHVLHTIATANSAKTSIQPILELGRSLTGAVGAAFILFNDPVLVETHGLSADEIAPIDVFRKIAEELPNGIHLNPVVAGLREEYPSWLIAQIKSQGQISGVLWLVFSKFVADHIPNIEILIDGLSIVASNLQSQSRHERIVHNQNEFVRIVSHDLRSPLTSVKGYADMLESGMVGELEEKQFQFIEKISAGVTQMTALVENIQDAGRYDPENGVFKMQRAACDIAEIVDRVVLSQLIPAEKPALKMEHSTSDDIPIISADGHMLERALTNLVDNAVKYTPDGGLISISAYRKNDDIIIAVQDNGLGISPENQKVLFERHRRIPREEFKRIKGTGLGLFIVRSAAQRHGGDAWVESQEGTGSTFYMRIPIQGSNILLPETDD